jgi:uncharacterized protein (TIGR02118 family)
MISVSVMYANAAGKRFDHDYYARKHMPLVLERLRAHGMTRYEIDRGLGGAAPGTPAPYLSIGRLYFETLAGFEEGFAKHGPELLADIPNYSDAEVSVQVSETA